MPTATTQHVQSSIDAYWSARAEGYHAHQEQRHAIPEVHDTWARIWSSALPDPPATILEPGTGTGHVALLLGGLGHEVTGIDHSPGMVARARANAAALGSTVTFREGDAVAPDLDAPRARGDLEERHLDAVVARYLLWTLREPVTALRNWRALLRPGGRLAIVDGLWFADGLPDDHGGGDGTTDAFRRHYDDEVLAALPLATSGTIEATADVVREAGFEDVEVRPLPELLELDRRHGVAPGHRPELQYLITATSPRFAS